MNSKKPHRMVRFYNTWAFYKNGQLVGLNDDRRAEYDATKGIFPTKIETLWLDESSDMAKNASVPNSFSDIPEELLRTKWKTN